MQEVATSTPTSTSVIALLSRDDVKQRFQEILGKRTTSFITSVLQIVASNNLLAKAEPTSIYHSAMVAATLDLPLNNNLGFAYIVPYNSKQPDGSYKVVAQFQIGYKGFKQLALRTGQFLLISATDVRDGEIVSNNRGTGEITFKWIEDEKERDSKKVIGYVSYFKLVNGFESTFFMTTEKVEKHAKQFSQTYKKGYGQWKDDFESMALKTVTKLNLSKNAPLSVDLQKAVTFDQGIIKDSDTQDVSYVDNETEQVDKESERLFLMISDAKTLDELKVLERDLRPEHLDAFTVKKDELESKTKKK